MNEFEIAVINEPSMFEPSNSYHFTLSDVETFFLFFRRLLKDGRPFLFHSFRNKYFNKISLGNMLYFQNKL